MIDSMHHRRLARPSARVSTGSGSDRIMRILAQTIKGPCCGNGLTDPFANTRGTVTATLRGSSPTVREGL